MPASKGSAAIQADAAYIPGSGQLRGDEGNADLNVIKTTVTLVGDETTSTVVTLTPPIRQGQVIVPALSYVSVPATAATTLTGKLGHDADDDALATGINLGAAGVKNLGSIDTDLNTIPSNKPVQLSFSAASAVNASATLTFYLVTRSV